MASLPKVMMVELAIRPQMTLPLPRQDMSSKPTGWKGVHFQHSREERIVCIFMDFIIYTFIFLNVQSSFLFILLYSTFL